MAEQGAVWDVDGPNVYGYVGAMPIAYVDPRGASLWPVVGVVAAGAIAAGLAYYCGGDPGTGFEVGAVGAVAALLGAELFGAVAGIAGGVAADEVAGLCCRGNSWGFIRAATVAAPQPDPNVNPTAVFGGTVGYKSKRGRNVACRKEGIWQIGNHHCCNGGERRVAHFEKGARGTATR